jgi:hypothetical protein
MTAPEGNQFMRVVLAIAYSIFSIASAVAQGNQTTDRIKGESPHSTGRTYVAPQGQTQPQGNTGPLETASGGAPAESPQGQTPPGMQAAPEGSSKTIVETVPAPQR